MKASRQKNQLTKLLDDEGRQASSIHHMGKIATDYFDKLFSSSGSSDLVGFSLGCLEAVFASKASSAPGCDGMNGLFFQEYWDVIGVEITNEVKAFF